MIITCNNCAKKFEIDSGLIPDNGRLLQCNSCKHKWFFKKVNTNEPTQTVETYKSKAKAVSIENADKILNDKRSETLAFLDNSKKNDFTIKKVSTTIINDKKNIHTDTTLNSSFKKKNKNFLNLTIVFIISFIAIIILLDTFQKPISIFVPNIEFILYNLYETINDIVLFFSDLI